MPFDPNAGWKAGDLISDYAISREDSARSAANNNAIASWKDGLWTNMMVRPLGLTNDDDKPLGEGGVYNVGFRRA
ncbi:ethylbenzene dehydrogenase-related protein [Bradyrhizobium sp. CCBAU 051011]|uniref:ethylbenzene dehydrogenase-related protein n=1 Tax=Bradyrhizobium sp. CCBAU 051011 TaxID=858422 RepID=UPI001FF02987|nr:ethylbenzene dehydrogenase-related protein [Bradyrhizobium sp. CCBAU 051011]